MGSDSFELFPCELFSSLNFGQVTQIDRRNVKHMSPLCKYKGVLKNLNLPTC